MNIFTRRLPASLLLAASLAVSAAAAAAPINLVMHKSPYCGCCGDYAAYLQKNGFKVRTVNHDDMSAVKARLGTQNAASCHTMQVNAYVVEGHVPVAAIHKMLRERPNIKGIALPGMPYHSPGMGPEKPGSLSVMQIERNGAAGKLYMRL
ncbi:MAG: CopG family transcriptional regulator [Neisseria sp.]|nr:CopG family transcriptional regulator [Neisseria sp.]MBP8069501.1 CopG family transcriptional regulator [Neisseria sp.]